MGPHSSFRLANERAREMKAAIPRAIAAYYDRKNGRIVIDLSSKLSVAFSPHDAEGLEKARPRQLEEIEISPSGFGIHFPRIDADIYLPALLEGFLGSRKWMAARLGQSGGRSRSTAKKAAAKANGKLGGRPKKVAGTRQSG
jgi:adenosylmethionine-8-amino-7-oxononanoate aminotransferase